MRALASSVQAGKKRGIKNKMKEKVKKFLIRALAV
jgi:hypothetical protein